MLKINRTVNKNGEPITDDMRLESAGLSALLTEVTYRLSDDE